MERLLKNWFPRLCLLALVTVFLGLAIGSLESTHWAESIREVAFAEAPPNDGKKPNSRELPILLIRVLPALKLVVMMGVPMLLCLGSLKIGKKISRSN